jgi:hypothetical protein
VPVEGLCGCEEGGTVPPDAGGVDEAGGVAELGGAPLGTLPPDVPSPLFFFFFASPGCTGSPVETGGAGGAISGVVAGLEPPPPLDAIAITTIRKNAATASAASLRRR